MLIASSGVKPSSDIPMTTASKAEVFSGWGNGANRPIYGGYIYSLEVVRQITYTAVKTDSVTHEGNTGSRLTNNKRAN